MRCSISILIRIRFSCFLLFLGTEWRRTAAVPRHHTTLRNYEIPPPPLKKQMMAIKLFVFGDFGLAPPFVSWIALDSTVCCACMKFTNPGTKDAVTASIKWGIGNRRSLHQYRSPLRRSERLTWQSRLPQADTQGFQKTASTN